MLSSKFFNQRAFSLPDPNRGVPPRQHQVLWEVHQWVPSTPAEAELPLRAQEGEEKLLYEPCLTIRREISGSNFNISTGVRNAAQNSTQEGEEVSSFEHCLELKRWSTRQLFLFHRFSYTPDCQVVRRKLCDQVEKKAVQPVCTEVGLATLKFVLNSLIPGTSPPVRVHSQGELFEGVEATLLQAGGQGAGRGLRRQDSDYSAVMICFVMTCK